MLHGRSIFRIARHSHPGNACPVIDLDANATTPLAPEVLDAMMPWLQETHGSNPSATHRAGRAARKAIERAREQVASLVGATADEIVFTSGGTESINAALQSLHHLSPSGAMVTSAIEHSAVLRTCAALGREIRSIPVDHSGIILSGSIRELLPGTAFVSTMWANNETGTIQPITELAAMVHEAGIPFHTDAVQAVGRIPVDVRSAPIDLLSLSAHKFHGPKGVGALYIRRGMDFHPLLHGGGQEQGRRSGTENTAAIVGMGAAAESAQRFLTDDGMRKLARLRDEWEELVFSSIEGVTRNGHPDLRLPNTSHLSFVGCDAAALLILLDQSGIACSVGSACMSGKQNPSHVQLAMGIPEDVAKTSVRFSLSHRTTADDIRLAAECLQRAVWKIRSVQGSSTGPVVVYSP